MSDLSPLALALPALLLAGASAGFAGGLFGIGGGVVVVPALMFLLPVIGVAPDQAAHVAVGTSLASIIFTSIRSTASHAQRGAVDFGLLRGWAGWVVLGTAIGTVFADMVSGAYLALIFGALLAFFTHFQEGVPHVGRGHDDGLVAQASHLRDQRAHAAQRHREAVPPVAVGPHGKGAAPHGVDPADGLVYRYNPELAPDGLPGEEFEVAAAGAECHDLEKVRGAVDDVNRLCADGTGGPEEDDLARLHASSIPHRVPCRVPRTPPGPVSSMPSIGSLLAASTSMYPSRVNLMALLTRLIST